MIILIFFVLFTLTISFFCSLLEATLLSFSPSQVATLEQKSPAGGAIWRGFKDNIERPIAVILITNTAAHTVGATLAGAQFDTLYGSLYGSQGLILFSVLFTYLMLQFTEILPKSLGVKFNGLLAPAMARPLSVLIRLMAPFIWFVRLVNRPFEGRNAAGEDLLDQIGALAASASLRRTMDPRQARMIQAASEVKEIKIRQIMTPRSEVISLRVDSPIEATLDLVKRCPFTRIPVFDEESDHVVGMVHVRDILTELDLTPGRFDVEPLSTDGNAAGKVTAVPGTALHVFGAGTLDLRNICREVLVLPDHLNIFRALRRFQDSRIHLAVVVDEYGSSLGIVTLEDVLEELVGEIEDEFDPIGEVMVRREGDSYFVNARLPLHELQRHIADVGIEHSEVDADTVGGFVVEMLGRMAQSGESIEAGNYRWIVVDADAKRVSELKLTPLNGADPESGETASG